MQLEVEHQQLQNRRGLKQLWLETSTALQQVGPFGQQPDATLSVGWDVGVVHWQHGDMPCRCSESHSSSFDQAYS